MDTISISMASIPARSSRMIQTVRDFAPRCDNFFITLDGYTEVPVELAGYPNVHPLLTNKIGPRAKFSRVDTVDGYHILMDDDIVYPDDYVAVTVRNIDRNRSWIIGYHGSIIIRHSPTSDVKKLLIEFDTTNNTMLPVHMLGSGTIGFHSDRLALNHEFFAPGCDDEQLAIYCQRNRVPMTVMPHQGTWMKRDLKVDRLEAICRDSGLQHSAYNLIKSWPNWNLYC